MNENENTPARLTTEQAFERITSERNWQKPLGYSDAKAWSLKHKYQKGKLSIDAMEAVLKDAGFIVVQEKRWGMRY